MCSYRDMDPKDLMKDAHSWILLVAESKSPTARNATYSMFPRNFLFFGVHVYSGVFQKAIGKLTKDLRGMLKYQNEKFILEEVKEEFDQHHEAP
ncbi:hypothetical protein AHF37_09157 [Paragonimus kellicotti]|nr:hypothetical protein AHF37_09157 [Paragonimus kellicotti]